jgi:hypothetical protein
VTVRLGALYHWSPRQRLNSIKRLGLMPGRRSIRHPEEPPEDADARAWWAWRAPYICFGTSPSTAWDLGLIVRGVTYDLWEVYLRPQDEVYVLPTYGPQVDEIRLYNRVPKSRLIFVGERTATKGRNPVDSEPTPP